MGGLLDLLETIDMRERVSLEALLSEVATHASDRAYALTPDRRDEAAIARAPTDRFAAELASALSPALPNATPEALLALSRELTWTANGVLEGALREPSFDAARAAQGILSAWRGLVVSWLRSDGGEGVPR